VAGGNLGIWVEGTGKKGGDNKESVPLRKRKITTRSGKGSTQPETTKLRCLDRKPGI